MTDEYQMKCFDESGYVDPKIIKEIINKRKTFAERLMEKQEQRLKEENKKK